MSDGERSHRAHDARDVELGFPLVVGLDEHGIRRGRTQLAHPFLRGHDPEHDAVAHDERLAATRPFPFPEHHVHHGFTIGVGA